MSWILADYLRFTFGRRYRHAAGSYLVSDQQETGTASQQEQSQGQELSKYSGHRRRLQGERQYRHQQTHAEDVDAGFFQFARLARC